MKKDQNDSLINFLKDDATNSSNLAQKKEIAAWLATVFYMGILTTFINLKSVNDIVGHYVLFITILICIFLLFISVCYFIYSNFSSIYNSNAYYLAIKQIIFKFIDSGDIPSLHITNPQIYVHPDIISEELKKWKESISPKKYRGNLLKLLIRFWLNIFLFRNQKNDLGSNHMIQESAIYSLLFISTFSFYFIIIVYNWCKVVN